MLASPHLLILTLEKLKTGVQLWKTMNLMVLPGLEGENRYNREHAAAKLRQAQIDAWEA